jgi:hypothetical protein
MLICEDIMHNKIFVTTFNKRLFDNYAKKMIQSYKETDQILPLYVFVEDDINVYPKEKNVHYINLFEKEPDLKEFVDRNKHKKVEKFSFDAVRFSYKVYAQNAARQYGEKIYYVDSDSVFVSKIPEEWFDECLPDDTLITFYDRPSQYTETGFLAFNNTHLLIDEFFEKYTEYYRKNTIFDLKAWTDCHTLDATRRICKFKNNYKEKALGDGRPAHIMARDTFINKYIDHRKGDRKTQANSPEWIQAKMKRS